MHPELLNNTIFLRYYDRWQKDPTSVVFSAIAEYFIAYRMLDEAIAICHEGLRANPGLVMGRLSLAKAYYKKKEYAKAQDVLKNLLQDYPDQEKGLELMELVEEELPAVEVEKILELKPEIKKETAGWATVTMAKIYTAQGLKEKARQVYLDILQKEPDNPDAASGLKEL